MVEPKQIEEIAEIINKGCPTKIEITPSQWKAMLIEGTEFFGIKRPENGMVALLREQVNPRRVRYFIQLVLNDKTE